MSRGHWPSPANVAVVLASIDCICAELFLDAKELIILGKTLRTAGGACLDLTCSQSDSKIAICRSSVSPDRCDVITPQPAFWTCGLLQWLQKSIRSGLPWAKEHCRLLLQLPWQRAQVSYQKVIANYLTYPRASKNSSVFKVILVNGSSMETMGYSAQNSLYIAIISSPVFFMEPSLSSVLKSRSYILSAV